MTDVAKLALVFEEMDVPWEWDGEWLAAAGRVYKTNDHYEIVEVVEVPSE